MIDAESLQEFKRICKVSHRVELLEIEAQQAAERVIRFLIASGESRPGTRLSEREAKTLQFVKEAINQGRIPSVRGIAAHLNLASSRSAHVVVQNLVTKQLIARNQERKLVMVSRT